MPRRTSRTGSELFIVDNSDDDWKVLRYLHDWCQLSKAIDIATGYFEIGGLLGLNDEWQKVDGIRILMGDEVSGDPKALRRDAAGQVTAKRQPGGGEGEKRLSRGRSGHRGGDSLGKISCRVYKKDKFHAKAYITHARQEVVGSFALVGSSNLTLPGITENVELNVQIAGTPVSVLQEWYEEHWNNAEDVTAEILRVIERPERATIRRSRSMPAPCRILSRARIDRRGMRNGGREHARSRMYPVLDKYQKEAYHALLKIAAQHGGAFLCDGVGLGKTFVGLMLIERLVMFDRKRVVLIVPKAARHPVWERDLRRYLRYLSGDFSNLTIFNHTDLLRGGEFPYRLDRLKEMANIVIIDEAHHFRNPGLKGEEGESYRAIGGSSIFVTGSNSTC